MPPARNGKRKAVSKRPNDPDWDPKEAQDAEDDLGYDLGSPRGYDEDDPVLLLEREGKVDGDSEDSEEEEEAASDGDSSDFSDGSEDEEDDEVDKDDEDYKPLATTSRLRQAKLAAGSSSSDAEASGDRDRKRERRDVWKSFDQPWMKISHFLEMGDRFSIKENGDFYVVVRNPKQKPGYLAHKSGMFEENGFIYSEYHRRWQKPKRDGLHDLETWRPLGHSYEAETGCKDVFDEFA